MEMNNIFSVGDIVMPNNAMGRLQYFIIKDVNVNSGDVELLRIYPIEGDVLVISESISSVTGVAKINSPEWKIVIDMVNRKRKEEKMGDVLDEKRVLGLLNDIKEEKVVQPKLKTHNMALEGLTDVVRYDNFEKIDDCLDAINALREAEKVLKEPIFGEKIAILFKRLQVLSERNKK